MSFGESGRDVAEAAGRILLMTYCSFAYSALARNKKRGFNSHASCCITYSVLGSAVRCSPSQEVAAPNV
jgi:hypothetical protein